MLTRFSRLPLSISPSLYLPTRLVITSGAEELMAHFRKKRREREREGRNHVLLLLEARIKCQMTDRLRTFAAANSDVHMHASMHACKQRHGPCACTEKCRVSRQRCGETLGWESWGSPQNISRGKPLLFCSAGAAEEEMPLAAQSCTFSVITSNLIKWRLG